MAWLLGFEGGEAEWEKEYVVLCRSYNWNLGFAVDCAICSCRIRDAKRFSLSRFFLFFRMTCNLTSPCFAPSAPFPASAIPLSTGMNNLSNFFPNQKCAVFPRNESLGANRSGLTLENCIGGKQASVTLWTLINVLQQLGTDP